MDAGWQATHWVAACEEIASRSCFTPMASTIECESDRSSLFFADCWHHLRLRSSAWKARQCSWWTRYPSALVVSPLLAVYYVGGSSAPLRESLLCVCRPTFRYSFVYFLQSPLYVHRARKTNLKVQGPSETNRISPKVSRGRSAQQDPRDPAAARSFLPARRGSTWLAI